MSGQAKETLFQGGWMRTEDGDQIGYGCSGVVHVTVYKPNPLVEGSTPSVRVVSSGYRGSLWMKSFMVAVEAAYAEMEVMEPKRGAQK